MWRMKVHAGLIIASTGSAPEQDWGHGPYRRPPEVPHWLERFVIKEWYTKGQTHVVLSPVKLAHEIGSACLERIGGKSLSSIITILPNRPDCMSWPSDWPRDGFEVYQDYTC